MIRSAVFSRKKTNLCFLEALGSLRFLLVRGCPRLGQLIEKPISPRPSGTGIFPYSRMPARKRRPIFKAPPRGASTDGVIETGFPEGDLSFRVRSTRLNIHNYFFKVFTKRLIVLELELVLGAITSCLCGGAYSPKPNSDQGQTLGQIEFEDEDEDEFEDEFLDLVAASRIGQRNKILVLIRIMGSAFWGAGPRKSGAGGGADLFFTEQASDPNIDHDHRAKPLRTRSTS